MEKDEKVMRSSSAPNRTFNNDVALLGDWMTNTRTPETRRDRACLQ